MPDPSLNDPCPAGGPQRSARWTLLLVADDGRLRQVPHLKAWLTVGVTFLCLALACALIFFALYSDAKRRSAESARQLEQVRQELAAAREQHELLLAQAVIDGHPPQGQDRAAGAVPTTSAAPAGRPAAGQPDLVEAQELSVSHNKGSRSFQVHFKLKNNAGEPVTGYAFVVLYPQERDAGNSPLVIPDAVLEGDRPGPYKNGRPFTISRFTTVRLDGRDNDPGRFVTAGVVAFDKDGNLLLERLFDLKTPDAGPPAGER